MTEVFSCDPRGLEPSTPWWRRKYDKMIWWTRFLSSRSNQDCIPGILKYLVQRIRDTLGRAESLQMCCKSSCCKNKNQRHNHKSLPFRATSWKIRISSHRLLAFLLAFFSQFWIRPRLGLRKSKESIKLRTYHEKSAFTGNIINAQHGWRWRWCWWVLCNKCSLTKYSSSGEKSFLVRSVAIFGK